MCPRLARWSDVSRRVALTGFKVSNTSYVFTTKGEVEFVDLTDVVQEAVAKSAVRSGIVHVFAPHATGMLVLTENEPNLLEDIRRFMEAAVPRRGSYSHPSNAHSHLRSMLFQPDKTLPVIEGRVELGAWQSLLFVETDVHPRRRMVVIQVLGEE